MRKAIGALVIVWALSALALTQSPADRDAESKILALESLWNQAERNGDIRALALIFDDTMVYIDNDGALLTRTQFLAHTKDTTEILQSLVTATTSVHVYGDTAVVTGNYRATMVAHGKSHQKSGRFMDTWALKNGSWTCVAAQATPIQR
jgi:ketosteroid isomerase-like protein